MPLLGSCVSVGAWEDKKLEMMMTALDIECNASLAMDVWPRGICIEHSVGMERQAGVLNIFGFETKSN